LASAHSARKTVFSKASSPQCPAADGTDVASACASPVENGGRREGCRSVAAKLHAAHDCRTFDISTSSRGAPPQAIADTIALAQAANLEAAEIALDGQHLTPLLGEWRNNADR
jgi:hypothetical protein